MLISSPWVGETHFTRDMSFPSRETHITRIVFLGRGTLIPYLGTLISSDMCPLPRNYIIPSVTVVAVVRVVTVSPVDTVIPIIANREVSQQVIHSGSQMVSHSVSRSANKSVGQSTTSQLISQTVKCQSAIWSVN